VQFARITGRTSEFAVRTALGGSRWRVVRQLLIESIMLCWQARDSLVSGPMGHPDDSGAHAPDVARFVAGWKTIRLDANAFLFALVIAVFSGVISGIAPSCWVPAPALRKR